MDEPFAGKLVDRDELLMRWTNSKHFQKNPRRLLSLTSAEVLREVNRLWCIWDSAAQMAK